CPVALPAEPPPRATPARSCPPPEGEAPSLPRGWVTFPDTPAAPRVAVEVARTDESRARGLMYRTALADGEGMLFDWPDEELRTFWMHDTCVPLDMMFIATDGTILGIVEQVPVLNDSPRGVPCPSSRVLEVPAGWSRAHGVQPGQRIAFES
ncbi:MAG: DUF192 domain-containing protein, partial [Deltaproteobacteria bacterium]|nr:DUF192 domain-containing protein [Deltaproteobacteria bacterium]